MDSPKNGIRDGMFIKNFKTNDSRRNSLNSFSKINRESPKIRKLSVSYSIKKKKLSREDILNLEKDNELVFEGELQLLNATEKKSLRYLFLFSDVIIVTKKKSKKDDFVLDFTIDLPSCTLTISSDYFTLTEVKAIQQYPFTIVFRHSFGLKFSLDTWIDKLNKVLKQNRESNSHITEANIDLSEREWKVLQTAAEEKTFSKNQVILQQNKPFQGLYRVKSGAVRIEQQAPEETKILGILSVNQIFGEMSFFNRETTASIVAESSEVAVYHFSASVLISILSSSPELCLRFFKMICSVISFRLHNLPVLAAISKINDDDEGVEEGFRSADFQSLASYKDAMVQKMFNLSPDSVVMKEFEIKFKKKTGTLYLFPQHLGFTASKSEGTTFVISLSTIIDIEKNVKKNAVICYTENKKYTFYCIEYDCSQLFKILKAVRPIETPKIGIERAESLGSISWDELFTNHGTKQTYQKDQMVLQTGEIPKGLYYLYSGMCRIVKAEDQILRRVTGGNFFGEVYYFFGGEAKVSVIAEDEVQIYVLDRLLIEKALTRNPSLGFPLYKSMALQISTYLRKYETRLLHTKTQRRINRMQDAAHFGIEYLKNKKFKLSEWWLQLIRQKCEEFLTELGYELNAIPSNYIDERPKSLEKVEKNLVILHQILNRNQDTTNLTQKLIEPLKNTIYPRIDNYIEQVKKVLKEENTSFGKSSSQEQIEQEPESLSDHIKNNVIPTIVDLEVKNQILDLLKDIKYLEDMKKFEFDYYQTQSSILLSSGTSPKDSSFHFKRINDVVPVTGLIIGRFHRLENEARTCLQVWKNK